MKQSEKQTIAGYNGERIRRPRRKEEKMDEEKVKEVRRDEKNLTRQYKRLQKYGNDTLTLLVKYDSDLNPFYNMYLTYRETAERDRRMILIYLVVAVIFLIIGLVTLSIANVICAIMWVVFAMIFQQDANLQDFKANYMGSKIVELCDPVAKRKVVKELFDEKLKG